MVILAVDRALAKLDLPLETKIEEIPTGPLIFDEPLPATD
jgi:hypothetical protein